MGSEHELLSSILDSDNMGVGGGSTAALAGSMAAALVAMVAKLSIGRNCGLVDAEYEKIAGEAERIKTDLVKGAEDDAKAYSLIKEAYHLPRGTEKEKRRRAEAIEKAYLEATVLPNNNAGLACRVQELSVMLEGRSNPNAGSDLKVAELLAYAGVRGCIANMEINIDSIKSEGASGKLRAEIKRLKSSCREPSV